MLKQRTLCPNIQSELITYSQRKSFKQKVGFNKDITISFVGDIKSNIEHLLNKICCSQENRSQVKNILNCYADKIVKLRQQRDCYKSMLTFKDSRENYEILRLQLKVQQLQKQLLNEKEAKNNQICTCENSKVAFQSYQGTCNIKICCCFSQAQECAKSKVESQSNYQFTKEKVKKSNATFQKFPQNKVSQISNVQEQLLISNINEISVKDDQLTLNNNQLLTSRTQEQNKKVKTISQEQIMRMMLKYNLGTQDLEEILKNYEGNQPNSEETENKKPLTTSKTHWKNQVSSNKKANKCFKKLNTSKCKNL